MPWTDAADASIAPTRSVPAGDPGVGLSVVSHQVSILSRPAGSPHRRPGRPAGQHRAHRGGWERFAREQESLQTLLLAD